MPYNATKRASIVNDFLSREFDILIIGGGITGAGIALDAISRGFTVALIEKNDFASGTSSKSTKLIHGGLRYLKNLEFKLVRDTGLERAVAFRNAPHLVRPEKMLLPLVQGGNYGKMATSFGLWLYDVLAWVRKEDRRKMLSRKQVAELEPLLRTDIVKGAGYYSEYRTDDARLTIEVLKSAAVRGACVMNYMRADEFIYQDDMIKGVRAKDVVGNTDIKIAAKYVVNAAGPWVDKLREKDDVVIGKKLLHTKGVHIVVPHNKLPLQQSVYFDIEDGRMIFAIPRLDITYLGTTDTFYNEDLDDPKVSKQDVDYLIKGANAMFPKVGLSSADIISSWAGLRPLIQEEGKGPSELSRTDELFVSDKGLITIAGGKLTGYRLMAKKVVRLICDLEKITRKCKTRRIKLCGADFKRTREVESYQRKLSIRLTTLKLDASRSKYLLTNYGTQTDIILSLYEQNVYPFIACAEAQFCIENEGVCRLEDFFVRRTGKLFFEPSAIPTEIDEVIKVFVTYFNWTNQRQMEEKKEIMRLLQLSVSFD